MSVIHHLRDAAIRALELGEWDDAEDLLVVLKSRLRTALATGQKKPVDGPSRDTAAWADLILRQFIPGVLERGDRQITARMVYQWVLESDDITLTADEQQVTSGRNVRWRRRVSEALLWLKTKGYLSGEPRCQTYVINVEAVMAALATLPLGI